MPETETNFLSISNNQDFHADPRAAAQRLRNQAHNLPPSKLDYAAELIRTAWELELAADEREKRERIAAAGVQA